eukprot:3263945-Prymnesium_polylepis.1
MEKDATIARVAREKDEYYANLIEEVEAKLLLAQRSEPTEPPAVLSAAEALDAPPAGVSAEVAASLTEQMDEVASAAEQQVVSHVDRALRSLELRVDA